MSFWSAVIFTVLAWIVGILLDANVMGGFLSLKTLLPLLVMGACVLWGLSENEKKLYEIRKLLHGQAESETEDGRES